MSEPPTNGLSPRTVPAAGALLWRRRRGRVEVAMVHRPRYDDWSWAKGKLDPGEDWPVAAAREVEEETGVVPRLGIPLPRAVYAQPSQRGDLKEVRYWAAEAIGGNGELEHEVDQVAWLSPERARTRLTYDRDAIQLDAVVEAERKGHLQTWPLLIVRHAEAIARGKWTEDDQDRPLDAHGEQRARELTSLVAAYGVTRVVSSPAARCLMTVAPYAQTHHIVVRTKGGLSEEGFEADPTKVGKHVGKAIARGEASALCTHRPLLPPLLTRLADQAVAGSGAERCLLEAVDDGLDKGEMLVAHVAGRGVDARIVAVERHRSAR